MTYKVRATCDFPEYVVKDATVWRRFRDFVALADRLAHSHRGYFVPPRPEGALAARDAFVRARMASLEAYLRRLAAHPTLRRSAELRVFLTSHDLERDVQWAGFAARVPMPTHGVPTAGCPAPRRTRTRTGRTARLRRARSTPARSVPRSRAREPPREGGQVFQGAAPTMAQSGGGGGGRRARPRDVETCVAEDDAAFIAEKDRVLRLEQELAIASQKAERVLLQEEKYGDALGELGLECIKLGKLEDEEANRGALHGGWRGVSDDGDAVEDDGQRRRAHQPADPRRHRTAGARAGSPARLPR